MSLSLIWGAFVGGLLSFFSPCIFPLIPVYISFVTGYSIGELKEKKRLKLTQIFLRTTVFILGFAITFMSMGIASSSIGEFLLSNKVLFARISGVLVIIFGLHLAEIFKLNLLNRTKRFTACFHSTGLVSSLAFGVIFAFGWSPCVGPMLSSILILAADTANMQQGALLLLVYSLGIGAPFLVFSFSINYFFKASKFLRRLDLLQRASGALLVFAGIYLIYNGGF